MGSDGWPGTCSVTVAVAVDDLLDRVELEGGPVVAVVVGIGRAAPAEVTVVGSPGGAGSDDALASARGRGGTCRSRSRNALLALTCAAYAPPTTATATITATMTVRRVRRLTTVGPCTRLPARCG